jgi:hypothetical protein
VGETVDGVWVEKGFGFDLNYGQTGTITRTSKMFLDFVAHGDICHLLCPIDAGYLYVGRID